MRAPSSPAMERWRARIRDRTRPRFEGLSFNRLVPNLMTLVGLCAGLTAIRFALLERWEAAAAAIIVAGVIDGLDGRIARLLKATTRFGAEFDSLADFLCFGVAPALVLYLWTLDGLGGLGWAPCLMFAVCAALRLARFNAAIDGAPKPAYASSFFVGVPAPAGAGLVLFPLFLWLQAESSGPAWLAEVARHPVIVGAILLAVAGLMVSTLPTWSFKTFRVGNEYALPVLLGAGLVVALLVSEPWATFALVGLLYTISLPFSLRRYRRLRAEAEAGPLVAAAALEKTRRTS